MTEYEMRERERIAELTGHKDGLPTISEKALMLASQKQQADEQQAMERQQREYDAQRSTLESSVARLLTGTRSRIERIDAVRQEPLRLAAIVTSDDGLPALHFQMSQYQYAKGQRLVLMMRCPVCGQTGEHGVPREVYALDDVGLALLTDTPHTYDCMSYEARDARGDVTPEERAEVERVPLEIEQARRAERAEGSIVLRADSASELLTKAIAYLVDERIQNATGA